MDVGVILKLNFRFEVIGKGRHPPRGNKWIQRNSSMTMTCASANPHPQNRNTDKSDILSG